MWLATAPLTFGRRSRSHLSKWARTAPSWPGLGFRIMIVPNISLLSAVCVNNLPYKATPAPDQPPPIQPSAKQAKADLELWGIIGIIGSGETPELDPPPSTCGNRNRSRAEANRFCQGCQDPPGAGNRSLTPIT